MRNLALLLACLAVAAPAAAQERMTRPVDARGNYVARAWRPQEPAIRAGVDQDGVVAAGSMFLGRAADRGGLQVEAALHGGRWVQVPLVLHADFYKSGRTMGYFALGPALVIDLREKDGKRVSAALSAGLGYERGPFLIDARYTSGKNVLAITAGLKLR